MLNPLLSAIVHFVSLVLHNGLPHHRHAPSFCDKIIGSGGILSIKSPISALTSYLHETSRVNRHTSANFGLIPQLHEHAALFQEAHCAMFFSVINGLRDWFWVVHNL